MKQIKVIPITKHLKNRINQHGLIWNVLKQENDKILVESLNETFICNGIKSKDLRWLNKGEFEFI